MNIEDSSVSVSRLGVTLVESVTGVATITWPKPSTSMFIYTYTPERKGAESLYDSALLESRLELFFSLPNVI